MARARAANMSARDDHSGEPNPFVRPSPVLIPITNRLFEMAERHLRDQPGNLRGLGRVRLQEFPACRQVIEQIVDLDDGAFPCLRQQREAVLLSDRDFAAAYTPWPRIVAGAVYRGDDTMLVPPSLLVAGRMALTTRERGPWTASIA
jgi:hypothetical protein